MLPYNGLALDEPTSQPYGYSLARSDEDIPEAMQRNFGGSISRQDLLDGLVDKIYEFRDGKVKEHLGRIRDFMERKNWKHSGNWKKKNGCRKSWRILRPLKKMMPIQCTCKKRTG